jgi:tetratricopeptide (TPR) repeat protein
MNIFGKAALAALAMPIFISSPEAANGVAHRAWADLAQWLDAAAIAGGVQEAQGDLSAALKSYSDGLAIFERLAKSDPGNAGKQRDLSVSYNKVGGAQEAWGDLNAALKSYSDGLAIAEGLAQIDPGNAGWQRELSVAYQQGRSCAGGAGRSQGGAQILFRQPG